MHLNNIFYYSYFYRYREKRKQIKAVVDIDFVAAKNMLDAAIAEHISFFPNLKKDFNYGERLMMEHANRHLETVIDKNDPAYDDNGIIKHQSDIVKEALLRVPKTDYS